MTPKILIVDDDPELIRLVGVTLQRAGYQPIAARNAEEALKKVRSEQPDLVILDVMIPGVSGIDICRRLRSQPQTLTLPIIMFSAHSQVDIKIESIEAGADDYLTKPINPKELVARVAGMLRRTQQLRGVGATTRGTIIGVFGAKGGVGCTTVALNLAIALAQIGQNVVAVELRSDFGTFSVQMGQEPATTIATLAAVPAARLDERTIRATLAPDASGIEALYGPLGDDRSIELAPETVETILETLARSGANVVVDLPNYFTAPVEAAIRLCDQKLIVTRPEADSLISGRRRLHLIKNWGVGRGAVDAIIVNHVALAMGINIEKAEEQLGCKIIGVIPPAPDACALVPQRGRPLLVSQPNNIASAKFHELAERLTARELT